MQEQARGNPLQWILAVLIALGTLAGLTAAYKRAHVEAHNRRVEIVLEYQEVSQLAQTSQRPIDGVIADLKAQGVSALSITEDTLASLEQSGAARVTRVPTPDGGAYTAVTVDSPETLQRIQAALQARRIAEAMTGAIPPSGSTTFMVSAAAATQPSMRMPTGIDGYSQGAGSATQPLMGRSFVPIEYSNLRTLGLGLSPDAVQVAQRSHLEILGRISNFPGVSRATAETVLRSLRAQGARVVIFNGDDVLGYRGLEAPVGALLRDPTEPPPPGTKPGELPPATGLTYGAVEFGKQRGEEKLTAGLQGDYVRVHSIQAAEMGQMDETEAIERFVRAARERNIRVCYVRLLTLAGSDAVATNAEYLKKIARGIEHGGEATGGGLSLGPAYPFSETHVSGLIFVLLALGTAAGMVWMVRLFCPLPRGWLPYLLLVGLCLLCVGLTLATGDMGRKLVALLAGVAFPAAACLRTFPFQKPGLPRMEAGNADSPVITKDACIGAAVRGIGLASAITLIGIVHVVGLLATRPFMVVADQFLGIKAQHAIPLLIVALAAVAGGPALPAETWSRYRARALGHLRAAYDEPARFGLLLLGIVALAGLALVVARTGNDAGVGVSGIELKARALLDRILPVRPRTKEFLVGHPAFVLALAWWWRGRRRLAIPAFVVGSLGQVSLLNTFCHIHTPLIVSAWRDVLGLILGIGIGIVAFTVSEWFLPPIGERMKDEG